MTHFGVIIGILEIPIEVVVRIINTYMDQLLSRRYHVNCKRCSLIDVDSGGSGDSPGEWIGPALHYSLMVSFGEVAIIGGTLDSVLEVFIDFVDLPLFEK